MRIASAFSFGKTFHSTGWKLGYAVAPPALSEAFRNVHQWNVFSVNSFAQMAIAEYLENESSYLSLPQFYQGKRDFFDEVMKGTSLKPLKSHGTYFQLYDYSEISNKKDTEFAEWLVKEFKIASIPISPFCSNETDTNYIRLCFAKTNDVLEESGAILSKL